MKQDDFPIAKIEFCLKHMVFFNEIHIFVYCIYAVSYTHLADRFVFGAAGVGM